jgi:MYXO-CTERM domain-containing protein
MKFWVNLVAMLILGVWLTASARADVGLDVVDMDTGTGELEDVASDVPGETFEDVQGDAVPDTSEDVSFDPSPDAGDVQVSDDAIDDTAEGADASDEQQDVGEADATPDNDGDVSTDVSNDVSTDVDGDVRPPDEGLRLSGRVILQGRGTFEGVNVSLQRQEGQAVGEAVTDPDGEFLFEGLSTGAYELTLTHPGYVTFVELFTLTDSRRVEYELFLDADVALFVEVVLNGPAAAQVEFTLSGARGAIGPESILVEQGRARWEVETLPIGLWTLRVQVAGYQDVHYRLAAREGSPVQLRIYPIEAERRPEIRVAEGCACTSVQSRAPGHVGLLLIVLAMGCLVRRRRR